MIGEISGGGNIRQGKVWSGNSPVREVSIGEVSVGELPGYGTVPQSINFNNTLNNFLRKYVSIIVFLCTEYFTKGAANWSFRKVL